ncbi:hypothetical protein K461DRAFT_156385 [Myriangium duriaei CBS 260.36]|uniref:Rhodopsin domain-containing protein n=1 Tax=Myriangium duriaei CBS 260.36 TaxID=1168546 RepID=A0A9P4MG40_9PEZI|nr:hypothetical protein K461DRAFT_156385 [Myriangium duriaei CBS 260.36]
MLPLHLLARGDSSASGYQASLTKEKLFEGIYGLAHVAEAFLVFIIISVALRMYVRLRITRQFGAEDWSMVVTFVFALAQSGLSIASCYLCLGLWTGKTTVYSYSWTTRCAGIFYVLTMMALKVSLGFFFLNIFSHRKLQTMIIYIIMGSSVVIGFAYWPVGFVTCAEIKAASGYTSACSKAIQTAATALFDVFSMVAIIGDLALAIMAVSAIWEAKLPIPTKLSASALLVLGCIGAVASGIRFGLVVAPASTTAYTQELIDLYKWCLVEIGVCVIAANLVMIRPLFNILLVNLGVMTKPSTTNYGPTTVGGSGGRSRRQANRGLDTEMDEAPLNRNEVKREVTVTISDEEKGSDDHLPQSHSPSFDGIQPRAM